MSDPTTLRVAVFPGGGARGYCGTRLYEAAQLMSGLPPAAFADSADVMCGTSIGAILACAFRIGKTPAEMKTFFKEHAKRIFTSRTAAEKLASSPNASTNSLKLTATQKATLMITGESFYASPYPNTQNPTIKSNYGHNVLHDKLVETFGTSNLISVPTNKGLFVPAVNISRNTLDLFTNFPDPFYKNNATLVDVCRASSAAPFYLPKYNIGTDTYWDGGIVMNDPVAQGVLLGLQLKPRATRIVVITYGTGYGKFGFTGADQLTDPSAVAMADIGKLLDISMFFSEQNYGDIGNMLSARNINEYYYSKFNPYMSDIGEGIVDAELDNSSDSWFVDFDKLIDHYLFKNRGEMQSIVNRWMF